jgi:hypothetical protein
MLMTVPSPPSDTGTRPEVESKTSLPRWLYLVGIVVAILILMLVALHLAGGLGKHGPARHVSAPTLLSASGEIRKLAMGFELRKPAFDRRLHHFTAMYLQQNMLM